MDLGPLYQPFMHKDPPKPCVIKPEPVDSSYEDSAHTGTDPTDATVANGGNANDQPAFNNLAANKRTEHPQDPQPISRIAREISNLGHEANEMVEDQQALRQPVVGNNVNSALLAPAAHASHALPSVETLQRFGSGDLNSTGYQNHICYPAPGTGNSDGLIRADVARILADGNQNHLHRPDGETGNIAGLLQSVSSAPRLRALVAEGNMDVFNKTTALLVDLARNTQPSMSPKQHFEVMASMNPELNPNVLEYVKNGLVSVNSLNASATGNPTQQQQQQQPPPPQQQQRIHQPATNFFTFPPQAHSGGTGHGGYVPMPGLRHPQSGQLLPHPTGSLIRPDIPAQRGHQQPTMFNPYQTAPAGFTGMPTGPNMQFPGRYHGHQLNQPGNRMQAHMDQRQMIDETPAKPKRTRAPKKKQDPVPPQLYPQDQMKHMQASSEFHQKQYMDLPEAHWQMHAAYQKTMMEACRRDYVNLKQQSETMKKEFENSLQQMQLCINQQAGNINQNFRNIQANTVQCQKCEDGNNKMAELIDQIKEKVETDNTRFQMMELEIQKLKQEKVDAEKRHKDKLQEKEQAVINLAGEMLNKCLEGLKKEIDDLKNEHKKEIHEMKTHIKQGCIHQGQCKVHEDGPSTSTSYSTKKEDGITKIEVTRARSQTLEDPNIRKRRSTGSEGSYDGKKAKMDDDNSEQQ